MPTRNRWLAALLPAVVTATVLTLASANAQPAAPDLIAVASALPPAHFDPVDPSTRLDLFGARFGQTATTDLTLVLRTHQPFGPADVGPSPTRMLCVWLRDDQATNPGGRLCVVPNSGSKSGFGLRYTTLDQSGKRLGLRDLSVDVRRPGPTSISATFPPSELRLAPGLYDWQVRSQWGAVQDRLPDASEVAMNVALSTAPAVQLRCFGAASRDASHPCVNRKLRRTIVPTPSDAVFSENSPCTPLEPFGMLAPCEFGVQSTHAAQTVALVGDSHASHWRAALEVVAQHKQWRGVSITRSGCPFTQATSKLDPPSRAADCTSWNAQVPGWFRQHPHVSTVFVVAHFAADVVVPDGASDLETKVAGFTAAWKTLPKTVKHIIVIRDTPLVGFQTNECVREAQAKHRDAGIVCAVSRKAALGTDAEVVAARRLRSKRVRVIDMTRYLCSAKRCFPVIGGALVYKDDQHMTDVFAATLGPYLLRAIDKTLG